VDAVRDDLDTLVLDADLLEAVLSNPDPKSAKEIEIKLVRRMRKHLGNLDLTRFHGHFELLH
jgi:type I restriction enzyme R subunit